jgi:hypothetical protein
VPRSQAASPLRRFLRTNLDRKRQIWPAGWCGLYYVRALRDILYSIARVRRALSSREIENELCMLLELFPGATMSAFLRLLPCMVLFLAGCASSPSDLLKNPPDLSLASTKDAKVVAECIFAKWEDTAGGVATQRETEAGFRVLYIRASELGHMAEVDRLPGRTQSRFYNRHLVIGTNHWRQAVLDCQ